MEINNTTIELIASFGNILKKETEDKIEQNNINVAEDYFCMVSPNFVAFYTNPHFKNNYKFTIPNTKVLKMTKEVKQNASFSFSYNEDTASGEIYVSNGATYGVTEYQKDLLTKSDIENLLNGKVICEFVANIKDLFYTPFLGEIAVKKQEDDPLFYEITNRFEFINEVKAPIPPELNEDFGGIRLMDEESVSDIPIEPKYYEVDLSKFPQLMDVDVFDELASKEISEIKENFENLEYLLDKGVVSQSDVSKIRLMIDEGNRFSNELKSENALFEDFKEIQIKKFQEELSIKINDIIDKAINSYIDNKVKPENRARVVAKNNEIESFIKEEETKIKKLNSDLKKEYDKRLKAYEKNLGAEKKKREAEAKNKKEEYEEQIRLSQRVAVLKLSMSSDHSRMDTFLFKNEHQVANNVSEDFLTYISYNLLRYIDIIDDYKFSITDDGYCIIKYAGRSEDLQGLYYLMPTFQKDS